MAEHHATMEATLEALLKEKKYKTLKDVLVTMNPADVAAIFDDMEEKFAKSLAGKTLADCIDEIKKRMK